MWMGSITGMRAGRRRIGSAPPCVPPDASSASRRARSRAPLVAARWGRAFIDLNRAPDDRPLYPGRFETGLVARETFQGAIGVELASFYRSLGVEVTLIDRAPYPLQFMDKELVEQFVKGLENHGSHYLGESQIAEVRWDGATHVVTTLKSGTIVKSAKMLVALGRQANIEDLELEAAGIALSDRGLIPVNQYCQTNIEHIYAVGDMVSGPALASKAMEQGRRAVRHALNLSVGDAASTIPLGIYTIPEMASIGLDEMGAKERYKDPLIGRAKFEEIARAQISGGGQGLLKMVADPAGERLLGVQVVGDSATELVHIGQLALQSGSTIESFIDNVFNFPTYAEAYRIAALDILGQVAKRQTAKAA